MTNSLTNKINSMVEQGLVTDPKNVDAIKQNTNKMEGLQQASQQFETLFLQMVLKSMRSASDAMADEDSLVSSNQTRMYRDMHDSQLTMAMANKGNLGIADAMVKQLSPLVSPAELSSSAVSSSAPAQPISSNETTAVDEKPINTNEPLKSATDLVADKNMSQSAFSQSLLSVSSLKINRN
ncbi:rod-binding protein [Thalassotalea sp. PLHSN55]|uniref:rod-binding protein n=1 Tax=Thalassotalea sp. PLHSN55 TaxID=3435888 RepID=UPI003F873C66